MLGRCAAALQDARALTLQLRQPQNGTAMNKRKACFVGLAAVATLLAGCVAQYRNPSACEQEMRRRLADVSPAELSVTHSAVAYRGQRVVVEGTLDREFAPASGAVAASSAQAASGASSVAVAAGASAVSGAAAAFGVSAASDAFAASGAQPVAAYGASSAAAASGAAVAAAASGASAAKVSAEPRPTTPVALIAQKLGIKKKVHPSAAAECTFDESGLTAFRWLSPPALAKTTPDPNASDN